MNDHLSPSTLNALIDGELGADRLADVNQHLATCSSCTSSALHYSLLKSAASKAGQRYTPPSDLQERLMQQMRQEASRQQAPQAGNAAFSRRGLMLYGWATACALLLVIASVFLAQSNAHRVAPVSSQYAALATEVCDQHIATLASNSPPEVVSSDRHTVKPWFQGKLPFSFNLPENLPAGTTLDGANLTYLGSQPTAQLLYSIGKHRVSIFVQARSDGAPSTKLSLERAGFHVTAFTARDLEWIAVSDVDPAHLADLVGILEQAQAGANQAAKGPLP
jgi:anti-sigma factor RsiW